MLTPDYLDTLPDALVELWQQVEDDILRDIARRIAKADKVTETAAYQLWRFEETQALHQFAAELLTQYSGKSDAELRALLREAGIEALASDDELYRSLGFSPSDVSTSEALNNLLDAGYRQTRGTWKNLTATTANTVTGEFERALDRAWLQISSGAFDYKTAVKRAVDSLADHMAGVTYPSGHRDTLEVAARRAVLTGVNQTAAQLQLARADEMGCEFVETSAHAGARPEHAVWQGRVFHRGGAVVYQGKEYEDFETATGYGTGAGLCGWNCRHNFYPFFPGLSEPAWSGEELAKLDARDIEIGGKLYTRYEVNQMQRALERKVRKQKRRFLAEDAAGLDTADAAAQLKEARLRLADFTREAGNRADSSRTSVSGFGRSEAGRATAQYRKFPTSDIELYGHTLYDVTEERINTVPKPFFRGLSNNSNTRAQEYARELLRKVQNQEIGTEAVVDFTADGHVRYSIGASGAQRVSSTGFSVPYYSLHNHASNGILSPEDIQQLIRRPFLLGVGAVGHAGALYTCEKGYGFDATLADEWLKTLAEKYPLYKGSASLPDEALAQRFAFAEELRRDGARYGLTFSG